MKIKKNLYFCALIVFISSCHAKNNEPLGVNNSSKVIATDAVLDEGLFYVYRACPKRFLNKKGECTANKTISFEPTKDSSGQYVTKENTDQLFFANRANYRALFFSQTFGVEGEFQIGWSKLSTIPNTSKMIVLKSESWMQTNGYDINQVSNFPRANGNGAVGKFIIGLDKKEKLELQLDVISPTEVSINCDKIHTDAPVSNLCSDDIGKLWMHKIPENTSTSNSVSLNNSQENGVINTKSPTLKFENYPIEVYRGKQKGKFEDAKNKVDLSKEEINFAGHYVVLRLTLGFDATYYPIIDVKTGKQLVVNDKKNGVLSLTSCENPQQDDDVEHHSNSRLLIAYGREADSDSEDDKCMVRFYEERGGTLYLLKKETFEAVR